MRRLLFLSLAFSVFSACNCGMTRLRETPGQCEVDPSFCDPEPVIAVPDAGVALVPDAGKRSCTGLGTVTGRVCAPDQQTWVNGADVSIDAVDCNGDPLHVSTTSGADGSFELTGVPSGSWTVHAQSGAFSQDIAVTVSADQSTAIPVNQLCVAQKAVKIAVITAAGDQIENLLTQLNLKFDLIGGDPSTYASQAAPFLSDLSRMKQYDLIFFNCAAARSSTKIDFGSNATTIERNLHDYVAQGGSIYASDWALLFAVYAEPGGLDFLTSTGKNVVSPLVTNELMGYAPQSFSASVTDPGLAAFLGKSTLSINFPKQAGAMSLHWGLMQTVSSSAKVLVQAPLVKVCDGSASCSATTSNATNVPLAVSLKLTPDGQRGGRIIYTSFHNIAQSGTDVAQTLKYLVLHL